VSGNFDKLKGEVFSDPLVRGYSVMTDIQVADDINANERDALDRDQITSIELFDATDQAHFEVLGPGAKAEYSQMIQLGTVNVIDGKKGRTDLENMFASTGTLTALQALYSGQKFWRWQEIGLSRAVEQGNVTDVRR
jgi:hypothetical protein